ncbi:MAG: radical SAM protein [Spirochaetes bacterium]|nr:radical SAM protein [Spirochaetota bacterium]
MKAILVQPPFTQLNAPYPAVYYLEAFLRGRGVGAVSYDHSITLYRRIFSCVGLAKVFADAKAALNAGGVGAKARLAADSETARQIERYLSYEGLYGAWIDGLVDFLSGGDPGMAHRLASAVELPRGARTEAFLEARDGRIDPDEARALATRILDDLGDFITYTLDPDFGTVRYAEHLASSRADFGGVRAALDSSWLIREFYAPMLVEFWAAQAAEDAAASPDERLGLILITIPFPGCLLGALACAQAARNAFGMGRRSGARPAAPRPRIIFGGGYVSTELRSLGDPGIFDFCDYLSFDAGYGSLASIIGREAALLGSDDRGEGAPDTGLGENPDAGADLSLYRTIHRGENRLLIISGFPLGDSAREASRPGRIIVNGPEVETWSRLEREAVAGVFPDYRSADFASYLRIVDSENPMHRLWSDTPWLKYGLAHGCYWRRCSFCDTELEYVSGFARCDIGGLVEAAGKAAERTGLYGIHFVDEAMPMAALLDFARANRARAAEGMRPFSFWGNMRFDASWTEGRCEFLAASGLVAVSGGIEIATERGLAMTNKGFNLASLIRTLVALRRAGLLVHAYLIYGFPGQPAADIVDSAEFCRQLFASGLIDSAFWHRFVLTRHSRMYKEWKDGKRPELRPVDRALSFANNDLSFESEAGFDRFDAPLAAALVSWMEGNGLDKPASAWFGRGSPEASIAGDFAESLIASAEEALDGARPSAPGHIGGNSFRWN